ncbi:MAG TPA: AMP-binding protein [Trebonia sp.]|jgi:acyl-CoA synthetase (AMP-forming)/AMP-acid ligase II|nr:AMP-binding protein [Trebonia sp.]
MEINPIAEWVRRQRLRAPGRLAVRTRAGERLTYGELDTRSDRLANALRAQGLTAGDTVALWMDDQVANVEMYVAAAKTGLVLVPVNERLQPPEAQFIVTESAARAVLYSDSVVERLAACAAAGALDGRLLLAAGREQIGGAHCYRDLVEAGRAVPPGLDGTPAGRGPDEPYLVAFSSGTTGFPKGAVLTPRSVRHITRMSALARRLVYYGRGVVASSLSFPAAITADIFTLLSTGSSMVLMGRGWDIDELLSEVERERATFVNVLGPHIPALTEAARGRPDTLDSVISVVHGGSKIPRPQLAELHSVVGDRLVEVWGMVEHSGGPITTTAPQDYWPSGEARDIFESVGRTLPDCTVEVTGADGQPLAHDGAQVGELVVSSPALMRGYLGRPDATTAVLKDGWYHTGDLGTIDEAGYVYIVDRRKDLIVSGGINIYPSELERVIQECPDVGEVSVVGVPHPKWGRTPVAVVVPARGRELTAEALQAFLSGRLASYKKPTRVVFVAELPRNVSGKIVKSLVEDMVNTA